MDLFWNHVKLPKRKKTNIEKIGESLPILASNRICIGKYRDGKILVSDKKDIKHLYCNGFFGKGLHSKGPPKQLSSFFNNSPNINNKNNKNNNENNSDMSINDDDDDDDDATKNENRKNMINYDESDDNITIENNFGNNNLINNDNNIRIKDNNIMKIDKDNIRNMNNNIMKIDNDNGIEPLVLSHCEAFFLSFALGCLVVFDPDDNQLSIKAQWKLYSQLKPLFGHYYSAYHYFRSQGWVVRSGLKYAGDFVLYKQGPLFYHSSFNALLCPVVNNNIKDISYIEWTDLIGLNRITEQASKNLLLVYTFDESTQATSSSKPPSLSSSSSFIGPLLPSSSAFFTSSSSSSSSPSFITIKEALALRIEVLMIKRWAPNKEREQ